LNKLSDEEIRTVVLDVLNDLNLARDADQQLQVGPEAPLFGSQSPLDSLELVALAMDIEDAFAERGFDISLSDEKAMSRRQSPFRDVSSLVAYVRELISAESDGC
jgi:acyl carrier protein